MQPITNNNQNLVNIVDSDEQGLNLFNQIQLNDMENNTVIHKQNYQLFSRKTVNEQSDVNIGNLRKLKKLRNGVIQEECHDMESENKQFEEFFKKIKKEKTHDKYKRRKKQQKKFKKMMKLINKKKQPKLKRLRKQGDNPMITKQKQQSNNQQWSGQSSPSIHQDSDNISNDSLLEQLNPHKIKNKIHTNTKQQRIQKKQGFSLKQLGNDIQINYLDEQNLSDNNDNDSSYIKQKKKTKTKKQIKQIQKNHNMLRQLVDIGLCQQQQNDQQNIDGYQCNNGFDQVSSLKNSKKKIPKITNKLFTDMQINQQSQNIEQIHKNIELQVKPRINNGPSTISSLFLNKAQEIKKIRGMDSEIHNDQYEKLVKYKNKQIITKLLNQKQISQADQIELNVKIPQIVKGQLDLNNSIYFKKIRQERNNYLTHSNSAKKNKNKDIFANANFKISRLDLFKEISEEVKIRKSKDITHEAIKKSFKITQLEQIQQMRKRNEEKRRKQALKGSDDDDQDSDEHNQPDNQPTNKAVIEKEQQTIKQNNLKFLNSKIQTQDNSNKQLTNTSSSNKSQQKNCPPHQENSSRQDKQKKNKPQLQNTISNKQYLRLLQLEEGLQQRKSSYNEEMQIQDEDDEQDAERAENRDLNKMELEYRADEQQSSQQQQNINQQNHKYKTQKVQLQVDLQVSNNISPQQSQSQQFSQKQAEFEDDYKEREDDPQNKQYQKYLTQLQEEGIRIKKNVPHHGYQNFYQQFNRNAEKQGQFINVGKSDKQYNQLIDNSQYHQQHCNNVQHQQSNNSQINPKPNIPPNDTQTRKQFKKLRKIATLLKLKKHSLVKTRKAGQYYQQQAEEGSDNQQHDDKIKQINDDDQVKLYEGLDLDADLEQLIDNAVDLNQQDEQLAFKKYMEDVKIQDREQLRKIMRGDFNRRDNNQAIIEEMEEDQKQRLKRMKQFQQYMKKKEAEEGKDMYMNEQNMSNIQNEQQNNNDESDDSQQKKKQKQKSKDSTLQIQQQVQEMNQQNLKRYLDDCLLESFRQTKIVTTTKSLAQLPQSYQRIKKTQMRNTMKAKQLCQYPTKMIKLKKTSSHLNEMIMKNKEKVKPLKFINNFMVMNVNKR